TGGSGTGSSYGTAVATDPSGDMYVTGFFTGAVDVGGVTLSNSGGQDMFIARYHSDGTIQWAKSAGGIGSRDYVQAEAITIDRSGNVYVVGYFQGTVAFNGASPKVYGATDVVIAKYHPDGGLEWVKSA